MTDPSPDLESDDIKSMGLYHHVDRVSNEIRELGRNGKGKRSKGDVKRKKPGPKPKKLEKTGNLCGASSLTSVFINSIPPFAACRRKNRIRERESSWTF